MPVLRTPIADLLDIWVPVSDVLQYSPYGLLRFSDSSYVIPSIHIVGYAVKFWSWIVSWWSIMCNFSLTGIWINFILKFSSILSVFNDLASWNSNVAALSVSIYAQPFLPWLCTLTDIFLSHSFRLSASLRHRIPLLKLFLSQIIFARLNIVSNTEDFYEASSTIWSNMP